MRKIRIMEHMTLDGVIEHDENPEYGAWTVPYRSPEGLALVMEAQGKTFDLLLGRRTYDLWSGFWPKAPNSPIATSINAATKFVATHHPETFKWGPVKDLGKDIVKGVRDVKAKDGPDLILWGSSTLTSLLLEQGLVDEVVLTYYPILLGKGKRFFSDKVNPQELAFVSSKTTATGVIMATYRYVGTLKPIQKLR